VDHSVHCTIIVLEYRWYTAVADLVADDAKTATTTIKEQRLPIIRYRRRFPLQPGGAQRRPELRGGAGEEKQNGRSCRVVAGSRFAARQRCSHDLANNIIILYDDATIKA